MKVKIQKTPSLPLHSILGVKVSRTSCEETTRYVTGWARARESRYICLANVHMIMEAHDCIKFRQILNIADLVVPDGRPLAWILRSQQVCGRDLTGHICKAAEIERISVGFYGGKTEVLKALVESIKQMYPKLKIDYVYSPPFRCLTLQEKKSIVRAIEDSKIQILFVGLGCPKQERWMSLHRNRLSVVMVGIGGAFEMLAGVKPCVSPWMQHLGLEWLFRLYLEPRRLWRRNLWHSPRFIIFSAIKALKWLLYYRSI
jgi:N-acetylglucosaminyldiphosphoundecaprenol N-acetyl-beta-D-mannosaminyltransferase